VIAELEAMFFITPFSKISIGGKRDFVDSFYANFYEKDGGYIKYEQMIAARLLISFKTDLYYRGYAKYNSYNAGSDATVQPVNGIDERKDLWIEGSLLAEYRASDWLSFYASGQIWADITDFGYTVTYTDPALQGYDVLSQYFKFEVMGGIRLHY
jgi:hypothetical protein